MARQRLPRGPGTRAARAQRTPDRPPPARGCATANGPSSVAQRAIGEIAVGNVIERHQGFGGRCPGVGLPRGVVNVLPRAQVGSWIAVTVETELHSHTFSLVSER